MVSSKPPKMLGLHVCRFGGVDLNSPTKPLPACSVCLPLLQVMLIIYHHEELCRKRNWVVFLHPPPLRIFPYMWSIVWMPFATCVCTQLSEIKLFRPWLDPGIGLVHNFPPHSTL